MRWACVKSVAEVQGCGGVEPGIKWVGHCESCVYTNNLFLHNLLFGHLHTWMPVGAEVVGEWDV